MLKTSLFDDLEAMFKLYSRVEDTLTNMTTLLAPYVKEQGNAIVSEEVN